jgi:threonine dehydratase
MEMEKSVVEGAGAAPLAAMLSGQLPHLAGKRVVLVLCGGNIDLAILSRLIESALVADGRLTRFSAVISDRPGGLARLATVLAEAGASIKEITHDRAFAGPDVTAVRVSCIVETRDHAHADELFARLEACGIRHAR